MCAGNEVSAQVFTFECKCEHLISPDCDICNTNVLSRRFNGLLIYRNGTPYRWIDYPYTMRKLANESIQFLEQIPNPESITIAKSQTGFFTMTGYVDSTTCNCGGGGVPIDSILVLNPPIGGNGITTPLYIVAGGITTTEILNGTILAADLSQMGATTGQVMSWNGSTWAPATASALVAEPAQQLVYGTGTGIDSDTLLKRRITNGATIITHLSRDYNPTRIQFENNLASENYGTIRSIDMYNFAKRAVTDTRYGRFGNWNEYISWGNSINNTGSVPDTVGNLIFNRGFNFAGVDGHNPKRPTVYESIEQAYRFPGENYNVWEWHIEAVDTLGRDYRPLTMAYNYDGTGGSITFAGDRFRYAKVPGDGGATQSWIDAQYKLGTVDHNYKFQNRIASKTSNYPLIEKYSSTASAYKNVLGFYSNHRVSVGDSAGVSMINRLFFGVNNSATGAPEIISSVGDIWFDSTLITINSQHVDGIQLGLKTPSSADILYQHYNGNFYYLSKNNGNFPFWIHKNAPTYAFYMASNGKIGINNNGPGVGTLDLIQQSNDFLGGFGMRSTGNNYGVFFRDNSNNMFLTESANTRYKWGTGGQFQAYGKLIAGESGYTGSSGLTYVLEIENSAGDFDVGAFGLDPNGNVTGNKGDIIVDVNNANAYLKTTTGGNTGYGKFFQLLDANGASSNQVLKWNGSTWAAANDNNSGGTVLGTGAAGQVTYWSNSTTITGSNDLYFDGTKLGVRDATPDESIEIGSSGTGIKLPAISTTPTDRTLYYTNKDIIKFGSTKEIEKATTYSLTLSQNTNWTAGDYWDVLSISYMEFGFSRITLESSGAAHGSYRGISIPVSYANDVWNAFGISGTNNTWYLCSENTYLGRDWGSRFNDQFKLAVRVNNGTVDFRLIAVTSGEIRGAPFDYGNAAIKIKFYFSENVSLSANPSVLATTGTGMSIPSTYLPSILSGPNGRSIFRNGATVGENYKDDTPSSNGMLIEGSVAIGATTAARKLHVAGEARITDLTTDTPTQIVGADGDGDLGALTIGSGLSLSSGTLSVSGGGALPSGTSGQTLRYDGASWSANSFLYNTGTGIGIGTTSLTQTVEVAGTMGVTLTTSGSNSYFLLDHTSNTANSNAIQQIRVAGGSGGDPVTQYSIAGVETWSVGLDNSDSDKFKIAKNATPGTNDYFTITSTGLTGVATASPVTKLHVNGSFRAGFAAGSSVSDIDEVFIGNNSGTNATGATESIFFGKNAGSGATNARNSVFAGYLCGYAATGGSYSIFQGYAAGYSATDATRSIFLGYAAGYVATSAEHSVFIGSNSGNSATSATYSNFIGDGAGQGSASASYANFIGYQAGKDHTTGGTNSVLIGRSAGAGITTGTANTIIGGQIATLGTGLSNATILANGAGNISFYAATQQVAVGAVTTSYSHIADLDVVGTKGIILPSGTTLQRPGNVGPHIRYNSTKSQIEVQNGSYHYRLSSNNTATVSVNANAGSGATASVTVGHDMGGTVLLSTGSTGLAAGTQFTVTYGQAFDLPNGAWVTFSAGNGPAAGQMTNFYISTNSNTTFDIATVSALAPNTDYTIRYTVTQ
jgi:hypothetical protein